MDRPNGVVLTLILVAVIVAAAGMYFAGRELPSLQELLKRLRPKMSSWSRLVLDDHTTRLIDLERRVSSLESIESELFRGPPQSMSRNPQNSAESSASERPLSAGSEAPLSDVEPVIEAYRILEKMKRNWSNASASDRDRAMELIDAFLKSEVPF